MPSLPYQPLILNRSWKNKGYCQIKTFSRVEVMNIFLRPDSVALQPRKYGEYKLEKISQFRNLPLSSILCIDLMESSGFREKGISTRTLMSSISLNQERHHLLHISLTVYTLEEVRRQQKLFLGFQSLKTLRKVKRRF